jgi:ribosomal protein RSM22 (predicted rRNA methylase)
MRPLSIHPPPETLLSAVDAVARAQLDAAQLRPERLARAIRRVSDAYTRVAGSPAELAADPDALAARLCFFFPRDFPKVQAPLCELAAVAAFPRARVLRVLDLGSGLGATGLSAAAFALSQPGVERVEVDAVDGDARALALQRALHAHWTRACALPIAVRTRCAELPHVLHGQLAPPYHLVLLGFVLNELTERSADAVAEQQAWLLRASELLAADGAMVVLEPALRAHSRTLQHVRTSLAARGGPPYVFAPCLHGGPCPLLERERDWCHTQLPLALPAKAAELARASGLRTSQLSYSYLTLHEARRSLAELAPGTHAYRVVSAPLRSKGKLELLVCGAGPVRRLQRLDRHASALNAGLEGLDRGSVVQLLTDASDAGLGRVQADTALRVLSTSPAEAEAADGDDGVC